MQITAIHPDSSRCPLCGQANGCRVRGEPDGHHTCWCHDSALRFSPELLARVPQALRGKACICKACVLAFASQQSDE